MPLRGDRLRALREHQKYSQAGLAERLGLGVRQIHRYENNLSDPPASIVARIARELEVTTDYLLGLSDTPKPTLGEDDLSPDEARLLAAYRLGEIREALQLLAAGPQVSDQPVVAPRKQAANS